MSSISVKGVSKKYRIFPSDWDRLKEALTFGRKAYGRDFWALKDITLEVQPGTTLGVLGRNGAGKSTLLNIISGVLEPTSGTVEANGRLVNVSSVGALGFNPEFTGRENILLNGMIMGLERREIMEHFDDIAAFAEIGEFMDQPIKHYSTGMRSRLGFAVAVNVQPDILILDETLAGGDEAYKQAALQKMYELRDSGTTTLFVSHSLEMLEEFCNEAILLHEGRVMATGETTDVIGEYQALISSIRAQKRKRRIEEGQISDEAAVSDENGKTPEDPSQYPATVSSIETRENSQQTDGGQPPGQVAVPDQEGASGDPAFKEDSDFERRVAPYRSGTGEARIRGVELLDEHLRPVDVVASGSTVTVRVYLEYLEAVKDNELIVSVRNQAGLKQTQSQFYGPNLGYVLELFERYKEDPESVDERTRKYFEVWHPPRLDTNGRAPTFAGALFSASTALKGISLKEMEKGERIVVDFTFEVPLGIGYYYISAGARAGEDSYLDKIEAARTFQIKRPRDPSRSRGVVRVPTEIKVHTPEGERQGRFA